MLKRREAQQGPVVTYGLIGLCCLFFLVSPVSGFHAGYGTGDRLRAAQSAYFERWGVVPTELMHGGGAALLTPLTALFVHAGWVHLLGNMLFLYVFGAMAEERMGRLHFAVFYLAGGYAALCGYALTHASDQTLVGASGAISAVLGAFLSLFPKARVTSIFPFLLFLPLRFPVWIVLVFWLLLQGLAAQQQHGTGPGVAYTAHLVGFSLGFLYATARYRRTDNVASPATAAEGERKP